jgi:hypothetical protein
VKFDGIVEKGRGSLRAAIRTGNEDRRKPQQNQLPLSPPERQSHSEITENATRPATCRNITVVKEHIYTSWDGKIRLAEHSRHQTMHHAQTKNETPKRSMAIIPVGNKPWRTKRGIMIHMSHQYRSIVTKEEFARKAMEDIIFEEGSLGEAAIFHFESINSRTGRNVRRIKTSSRGKNG